ncbi:MAG TPA: transcription antitermination factor NusB [Fibrobacteria bacterium]|nr:transcription antitermination factor NusB [Fibrobacteria bacterium]
MTSVSGVEARRAAFFVLQEQAATGAFLKDLFGPGLRDLREDDAALARAICFGVLRMQRLLDYNLEAHAPRGIKGTKLRMALRIGACQLLFLSGIPAFAAVNTTVELVKREVGRAESGFANAVLKALAREGLRVPPGHDVRSLAVRHSHPEWLVRRWGKELKPQALEAALRRNNEEAPLWVRANPRRGVPAALPARMAEDGVILEPHPGLPLFFRLVEGTGAALRSEAFAAGLFSFQDPVSAWVVALLDWRPGLSLFDACSAPGGKSALVLETALGPSVEPAALVDAARLVCGDVSVARLRRLGDVRDRLGHGGLMPVCLDVAQAPFRRATFDRILVDAPCSNLGVLRRRPEARWHWTPERITALAERQRALLEGAAALLVPGGRLVYATCSAEREETRDVVRDFLAAHPEFRLVPADGTVPAELCREGCLRVWPGETVYDGFFAAALERVEADG